MRALALAALLVAVAAATAVVVLTRGEPADERTGTLGLVGDSLNVGVEQLLREALSGWTVETDSEVGRSTDAGIAALERIGSDAAPVLVISLGTNDPQADAVGFRDRVRAVLALAGPDRCVIWPTIWRGGPNDDFNAALADAAEANQVLRVVEWHEMVAAHPAWVAGDGVHPSPEGYAARAAAIAEVARRCLPARSA